MRTLRGGTQIYCPECKSIRTCKGINPSYIANVSGQRWRRTDHADINWFRRGRRCLTCEHEFLTAELKEDFVAELVELRDALHDIKRSAEAYTEESAAAAVSLKKLTESLNVLRALNIYQKA